MRNFGSSTRARKPGNRNRRSTKTSAKRLTIATIQSITGRLLLSYRPRCKEGSDVAAEKLPVGLGKLGSPGRHRRAGNTMLQDVERSFASGLVQVEIGRRRRQRCRGRSTAV